MSRNIVLDELHLTVFVPRGLSDAMCNAALKALQGRRFLVALRQAIRDVFRCHPPLSSARVTVTR
jgi:hypothetical protein